jgi:hypothetical protein
MDVLCVWYEQFAADVCDGTQRVLRFLEIADDGWISRRVDRIVPTLIRESDEETETWVALAERDLGNGLLGRGEGGEEQSLVL